MYARKRVLSAFANDTVVVSAQKATLCTRPFSVDRNVFSFSEQGEQVRCASRRCSHLTELMKMNHQCCAGDECRPVECRCCGAAATEAGRLHLRDCLLMIEVTSTNIRSTAA